MKDLPSQEIKVSFEDLAQARGYNPTRYREKTLNYVSHILKAKGKNEQPIHLKFDVKKLKNKKQSQDWLWVEFKNSLGADGWIFGDSNFIAFERKYDFLIVNRKELVSLLNNGKTVRYDLPFVNLAKRAKYRVYKREGKKEEITQINIKDLKSLESFQLWKKNAESYNS